MAPPIRFGTLGVARITPRALTRPADYAPEVPVVAVAARDRGRADDFARDEHIRYVLDDYQGVIDHERVNAIYNPLVISLHKEWTLRALEAGKHVLCEKSFALNEGQARTMADAAAESGLVLMDAFHYRYHPVFRRAKELIVSGAIGTIEHIEASFHVPVRDRNDIRMQYPLGGGVTMDIGCYPISWIRHLTDEEPEVTDAAAVEGPPDIDLKLEAHYRFPSGITAATSGDMSPDAKFRADLTVTGSDGTLTVNNPLAPQTGHAITTTTATGTSTETLDRRPTYDYQMDAFIDAVLNGTKPLTDAEDAVKQMRVIDACYTAAGLTPRGN